MRRPIIAGNWKMYKTRGEAVELAAALREALSPDEQVEIVLCPPYTALEAVWGVIEGSPLGLGAQDLYWEKEGAFTGEISPEMLVDAGCTYVILGHSERRANFGETDEIVRKKAEAALKAGLSPIICVGETLEQREADKTEAVVRKQVFKALDGLDARLVEKIVIAYEPIWAIGTGRTSTGEDANSVIGMIRQSIGAMFTEELAEKVRIQYGGSVKPGNIKEFMSQPQIDGALVGGASLDATGFLAIAHYEEG